MTLPDIDSTATYGGPKQDDRPVENPLTDESAADINKMKASVAGMTQTAERAIRRFVGHATTPPDAASNAHFSVWGNTPDLKPPVTKGGTGVYDITYPATVLDELGEEHTVNLVDGKWSVNGTVPYTCTLTITAPNIARLRVFDMAGVANDAVGATIAVFLR